MLWDLGLDDIDDEDMVKQKIEEAEDNFDLVMILEKFEESLILLKNELCWDFSDITSIKLNGRVEEVKTKLNKTTRNLLKDFLKSDYLLYDHFYQLFKLKREIFGKQRLKAELNILSSINGETFQTCSLAQSNKLVGSPRQSWGGKGLQGVEARNKTNEDCLKMTLRERDFVQRVRNIQTEKIRQKHFPGLVVPTVAK